jgi:hypothetical protein
VTKTVSWPEAAHRDGRLCVCSELSCRSANGAVQHADHPEWAVALSNDLVRHGTDAYPQRPRRTQERTFAKVSRGSPCNLPRLEIPLNIGMVLTSLCHWLVLFSEMVEETLRRFTEWRLYPQAPFLQTRRHHEKNLNVNARSGLYHH